MDLNYKRTRKHAIGKLVVMSISIFIPFLLILLLKVLYDKFGQADALDLEIFRWVILVVLEVGIISKIVKYVRIITSESWATDYLIKRNDERMVYIKMRTTAFTLKFVLYAEAVLAVVCGFISADLFYVVAGIIAVTFITLIATYCYFSKKN